MDLIKFPEKITTFLGRHKVIFGCIIPFVFFIVSLLFTKNLGISLTRLLNFISIPGYIIAIFVLDNTEENKRVVKKFINELGNSELIILENDIKILGNSICLSSAYFERVIENKEKYNEEIFKFNLSINKYIDRYKDLKDCNEVQNFLRFMSNGNTMTLLQNVKTYSSYLKVVQPLYFYIDIEIDKKSKARLKKIWDKKLKQHKS